MIRAVRRHVWFVLLVAVMSAVGFWWTLRPVASIEAADSPDEALSAVTHALQRVEYGFEPLLVRPDARLLIVDNELYLETRQPFDPLQWGSLDCFGYAYAARRELLKAPFVADVRLGQVKLPSPLGPLQTHVVARVTFADGARTLLDFTPLAVNVDPQYDATFDLGDYDPDAQFKLWQQRIPLTRSQPMRLVERQGRQFYVLAGAAFMPEHYQAVLQVHEIQPATEHETLRFLRGASAGALGERAAQAVTRQRLRDAGPDAFNRHPEGLQITGDADPLLREVLADHYYLLWHLMTKMPDIPATTRGFLPPGESVRIQLTPVPNATSETAPVMTLQVSVTDAETGALIPATLAVDGQVQAVGVSQAHIELPGHMPVTSTLTAEAPGYRTGSYSLRWHLNHSREMPVPFRLHPQ